MAPAKKTAASKKSAHKSQISKKPASKTLAKKVAEKKKINSKISASNKQKSKKKNDQRSAVKKATTTKAAASKKTAASKKAAPKKTEVKKAAPAKKADSAFRCPISGMLVKAEKPNISEKTLLKLKELLIEERAKHVEQMEDLLRDADELIADREGGDTVFDEESGEGDSVAVERERSLYLAAETNHTIDQIDAALLKIKNKTYGVCGPSSRRINVDRLMAIPWTDVCVDCKSRSERRL